METHIDRLIAPVPIPSTAAIGKRESRFNAFKPGQTENGAVAHGSSSDGVTGEGRQVQVLYAPPCTESCTRGQVVKLEMMMKDLFQKLGEPVRPVHLIYALAIGLIVATVTTEMIEMLRLRP